MDVYSLLKKKSKQINHSSPFPLSSFTLPNPPLQSPLLLQLPTSSVSSNVVQQPPFFFFRHHRSNHPFSFLYHRPSPTTAASTVPFHSQPSPSSISATSTSVSPSYRSHSSSHHKHSSNNRHQHRCFISAPFRKSSPLPSPLAPPASFPHNPSPATITPPATTETSQFNHRKTTTHLPFLLLYSPSQPTTVTPTPATLSYR